MIEQIRTIFSYGFMQNALLASLWISLAIGIVAPWSSSTASSPERWDCPRGLAGLVWHTIRARPHAWGSALQLTLRFVMDRPSQVQTGADT